MQLDNEIMTLLVNIFESDVMYNPNKVIKEYCKNYPEIFKHTKISLAYTAYVNRLIKETKLILTSRIGDNTINKNLLIEIINNNDFDMIKFIIDNNINVSISYMSIVFTFAVSINAGKIEMFRILYKADIINISREQKYPFLLLLVYRNNFLSLTDLFNEINIWFLIFGNQTLMSKTSTSQVYSSDQCELSDINSYFNLLQLFIINTLSYNVYNKRIIAHICKQLTWTSLYDVINWYSSWKIKPEFKQLLLNDIKNECLNMQKKHFSDTKDKMSILDYLGKHVNPTYGFTELDKIAHWFYFESDIYYTKTDIYTYIKNECNENESIIVNGNDYSHLKNKCDLVGTEWSNLKPCNIFIVDDYGFSKNDVVNLLNDDTMLNPYTQVQITDVVFLNSVKNINIGDSKYVFFFELYEFDKIHYMYMMYKKETLYKLITSDDTFSIFEKSSFDIINENNVLYVWEVLCCPDFGNLNGEDTVPYFFKHKPRTTYEFYEYLSQFICSITSDEKKQLFCTYLYLFFTYLAGTASEENLIDLEQYQSLPWTTLTLL